MYWLPRSITICGTCEDAALSRYTSGFPCTVWLSTGKSLRMRSTSQTSTGLGLIVISCSRVAIASDQLNQHHPRRSQGPLERIEHQPKFLKRYYAKQGFVLFLPQDHGCVPLSLRKRDMTLRDITLDFRAISKHEAQATLRH